MLSFVSQVQGDLIQIYFWIDLILNFLKINQIMAWKKFENYSMSDDERLFAFLIVHELICILKVDCMQLLGVKFSLRLHNLTSWVFVCNLCALFEYAGVCEEIM